MNEKDPSGRKPSDAGAKLDAGKVRPALVLGGFARALWKVSEVGTFGAAKYTEGGWVTVPNGESRYEDAQLRHWLKSKTGEKADSDSGIDHLAHEAWNALAKLDLALRREEQATTEQPVKVSAGWHCAITSAPVVDGVYKVDVTRIEYYSKYANGQWHMLGISAASAGNDTRKSFNMYDPAAQPRWLQE